MSEAESQVIGTPRICKSCGIRVGKGKSYCHECQRQKRLKIQRAKAHKRWVNPEMGPMRCPSAVLNFRRDELGRPIAKRCTKCDTWKVITEFKPRKGTPSGVHAWCKPCDHQRARQSLKKDFSILNHGQCRWCNRAFVSQRKRKHCGDACKKADFTERQRIKYGAVFVVTTALCRRCGEIKPLGEFKKGQADFGCKPTACNECQTKNKKRHKGINARNPKNKPRKRLSKRFHEVMSKAKNGGNDCFRNVIGCSTAFLRKHLENRFTKGMKWSNYGIKWHVDHILPVASFDHNDPKQVAQCWHYSNLRPLCAIENRIKSDKIITCQPELLLQLTENQ